MPSSCIRMNPHSSTLIHTHPCASIAHPSANIQDTFSKHKSKVRHVSKSQSGNYNLSREITPNPSPGGLGPSAEPGGAARTAMVDRSRREAWGRPRGLGGAPAPPWATAAAAAVGPGGEVGGLYALNIGSLCLEYRISALNIGSLCLEYPISMPRISDSYSSNIECLCLEHTYINMFSNTQHKSKKQ